MNTDERDVLLAKITLTLEQLETDIESTTNNWLQTLLTVRELIQKIGSTP